jgi:hypothetical protein
LPAESEITGSAIAVIADRPAVTCPYRYDEINDELADEYALIQDDLYGSLQEKFSDAFDQENFRVDADKMKVFWAACQLETQNGTLVAGWKENQGSRKMVIHQDNAASASSYYKEQLESMPPLACDP